MRRRVERSASLRRRPMGRRYLCAVIALVSCSKPPARSDAPPVGPTDSVVLERTRCLGTCPAYRLRVSRTGEVVFLSRYPGGQSVVDTVERWVPDSIANEAQRLGFFTLPESVTPGAPFCREVATDLPTITIGVFGARTKRVAYYLGCLRPKDSVMAQSLRNLPELAARIDTLTRAGRWIRPPRRP